MTISKLAAYLEELERTASRNEMSRLLASIFKETRAEEIDVVCYLLLGELVPAYRGVEFNIAEKLMIQVLAAAYGRNAKEVAAHVRRTGDIGNTAEELARHRQHKSRTLEVRDVYDELLAIANDSGEGSRERKVRRMAELLASLDPRAAKFVARIPVGKLRLGFSDATILDALSVMEKGDKSARPAIERAYNVTADIGEIATRVKKGGVASLKNVKPRPGVPIRPSLAERIKDIPDALKKAGPRVGVEYKLDGFRTQVHVWKERGKKRVVLFSRNLENTTAMFPEIEKAAGRLSVESIILDGETIGYNPNTRTFAPFQETVQRKRTHDIAAFAKKIPLAIFVFDVLYKNGESLLEHTFRERREVLEKIQGPGTRGSVIHLSEQKETDDPKLIARRLKKGLDAGLEGLVVKNLEAPYEAGARGFHWIKLKATSAALATLRGSAKKTRTQVLDTIDCVVMGAYKGRGKRTQFGIGGLLLGIRGNDGRYYTISRLGTGLSDGEFRETKLRIKKLRAETPPKEYVTDKEVTPDIWVKPKLVAEILADEITRSPRHSAHYSLRFPRLVRFRDDKNAEDTTTIQEIVVLWRHQKTPKHHTP